MKKIKHILFITNSTISGGAEICLKNLLIELLNYPLEIELLTPGQGEIRNLFTEIKVAKHKLSLGSSSIKFRGFNLYSPTILSHYFKLKNYLIKIHNKNKIDLIFVQQDPKEKILASILGQKLNIPVIWMEHSKLHPWQRLPHFKYIYRLFAKKVSRIITVSFAVKKSLISIGIPAKKIKTVWNGVRVAKLNNQEIERLKSRWRLKNKIVFGLASRLTRNKGVFELLEVAKEVAAQNNKIIFLIIGSGKEENNLRRKARASVAKNQIKFMGFQNNAASLNSLFDVVVSPSFDEGEGLPLRIIEGMALAKPIIATDISGSKEEVKNGVNGYLIKTHDVAMLKKKIIKLAGNQTLRKKMGEESLKIYSRRFTVEKMAKKIYHQIAKYSQNEKN